MTEIKLLKSKSHIVTLTHAGIRYKLFRIDFHKDGSIFVNFPYYKNSQGIASKVHMAPANKRTYDSLSLTDDGRITSHLVKYSHHSSGEALFSMDGKVRTEIRKSSVPLNILNGHIFTVQIQGLKGFEEAKGKKYDHGYSEDRTTIHFDVPEDKGAIRFIATWEHFTHFVRDLKLSPNIQSVGPQVVYNDPKDKGFGFLLSPDTFNPFSEHVLLLRAHQMDKFDKDRESVLGFIGGFDPLDHVNNLSKESVFLSLMYPVANVEEMKKKLLSMDFVKK